jgi:hypothetical protein
VIAAFRPAFLWPAPAVPGLTVLVERREPVPGAGEPAGDRPSMP